MKKSDLVAELRRAGINEWQATDAVDRLLDTIAGALGNGDVVSLRGFGTFHTDQRAASTGRNPRSGEPIKIPAKLVAKFKPAKALRDALNPAPAVEQQRRKRA